jgi:PAS domain S-box-containing protein
MSSKTTRIENLLEAVPDALVGMDQQGVIRFVNRQTESLFGYDRVDLVGQHIEMLVPEYLWQIYSEHREDYFADPRTLSMGLDLQLSGRQRDGTEFPVNISLSHIDTGDVLLVITAASDVTDQRQALENAQRMTAIVENSNDAIIGKTRDGIVTSWNPAAERMFGYSSEEIIGRSIDVLIPEDRTGEMTTILANVRAGQHVDHLETIRIRKDGSAITVSLSVSPIRDADGAIVGPFTITHDVTEARQAFEAAQRLAAIVEFSGECITSFNLDRIITSWNPAAERMFGYSSEEIIGMPARIMTPKDRKDEVDAVLELIEAGQHIENLETIRIRKDETVFPVSLSLAPILDAVGKIVGVSTIAHDMTEQNEALAAAQRVAAIVEYSDDAIIARTLDGIITSWNVAAERMFGYSSEEIVGKSVEVLIPGGRTNEARAVVAKISAGQAVEHLETIRIRKDGTVFPVSLTLSPICDADGAVVGAAVICRDVTEARQAFESARSMIESSLDSLVSISPEGRITDVNEATVKVTGIPREELIGTAFSECFTEPEKANAIYQLVFDQGMAVDYPLTMRHRDGTLTEVLYNASVYRDAGGKVLGVFAAARDVTQQKQAQKEIAEQRGRELDRLAELEQFQQLSIGRELKMIELKKEIESLRRLVQTDGGDVGDQR